MPGSVRLKRGATCVMNALMRARWLIPLLMAACGGSGTKGTTVAKAKGPPQDCGPVCAPGTPYKLPQAPIGPCDGAPGGLLGRVLVDGKQGETGKVIIAAVSSCASFPAQSDDKGVFRLSALPTGDYVVAANVGTQARAFGEVTIRPGEVVTVEIDMRAEDIARGREELATHEQCGCPLR